MELIDYCTVVHYVQQPEHGSRSSRSDLVTVLGNATAAITHALPLILQG